MRPARSGHWSVVVGSPDRTIGFDGPGCATRGPGLRVTRKVFVNRNVDVVFGYLTSPVDEPRWRGSVLRNTPDEPGVLRLGSTGDSLLRFMGREVEVPWEIVEFTDDARLCREYKSRVRGGRDLYMLQPFGIGSTIVEVELQVEASGLVGLLTSSRRSSMERELRADLQRLKAVLETS